MARRPPAAADAPVQRAFALEGKLSPRTLDAVLKRLDGSRSAAYLLISDGTSEKCFFFPVGACRLTSIGRRAALDFEDLVLRHPDLPAEARAELAPLKGRADAFDEKAQRLGVQEVIRAVSTVVVRDELLDAVVWQGASFEYQEINPPPRFYDHRLRSVKLSFGVKPLLEELAQAAERFAKAIGKRTLTDRLPVTRRSTPTPTSGVQARVAELLAKQLEGGPLAFEDLVIAARKRGIDAVEAGSSIVALADAGILELPNRPPPRDADEVKAAAQKDADWIERSLDVLIHELAARQRLADAYEGLGDAKQAAEHLRFVARELENRQKLGDAMDAYRRVLKLNPRDFQLRHRVVAILERLGRLGEAFDDGLVLARDLKRFGLYNRARQLFRKLMGFRPDDIEVRRELIDLLVKMGDNDEAVRELADLAHVFEEREQQDAALACQQQILQLDPANQAAKQRLQRAVRRSTRFLAPYLGLAAALLVASALGAVVYGQVQTIRALGQVRRTVVEKARQRDYAGAREAIGLYEARFGAGPTAPLKEQLAALERDARADAAQRRFQDARRAELRGLAELARRDYLAVLSQFAGTPWEARAQERLKALDAREEAAKALARRLLPLTEQYEREQEPLARAEIYARIVDTARELARGYAWSSAVQRTRIPVRIESSPPNAWVAVDAAALDQVTPCVVERALLPPFRVTVGLVGFEEQTRLVDLAAEESALPVRVTLPRRRFWRFGTLGPLRTAPLVTDDALVVAGADQRLYALGLDGRGLWERQLGPFAELEGTPVLAGGQVIVADRRGVVSALDARTGEARWSKEVGAPAQVVGATIAGTVAAWRKDRLVGLRARDGEKVWESEVVADPLVAAPAATDRAAVGATEGGRLLVWSLDSGRVLLHIDLKARLTVPPVVVGSAYAIATEDGLLRLLSVEDPLRPRYLWQQQLPGPATAPPAIDGGVVWVAVGERLLAYRADSGAPLPVAQERLDGVVRAAPLARGGRLYIGTSSGKLYALAATTGQLLWVYETGGPILAPVRVTRDMVLIASADFRLHAVQQ